MSKDILTPYKVTEFYFDQYYLKYCDSIVIIDEALVDSFKSKFENLEYLNFVNLPDVRQKIVIQQKNNDEIILFSDGGSAMQKNGKSLVYDSALQSLIDETIEKYSLKK